MDNARAANMPKDNVERDIHRGAGIGDDAVEMEEIVYEGYGPHGVALVISVVTDNRNRTLADLKYILSRNHGNLASAGSVTWQFSQKGYVEVNAEGADYVVLPRVLNARHLVEMSGEMVQNDEKRVYVWRNGQIEMLKARDEIIS